MPNGRFTEKALRNKLSDSMALHKVLGSGSQIFRNVHRMYWPARNGVSVMQSTSPPLRVCRFSIWQALRCNTLKALACRCCASKRHSNCFVWDELLEENSLLKAELAETIVEQSSRSAGSGCSSRSANKALFSMESVAAADSISIWHTPQQSSKVNSGNKYFGSASTKNGDQGVHKRNHVQNWR